MAGKITQGFRIDERARDPHTNKICKRASKNVSGNNSSMMLISRENLFKIRPAGLVSKNRTGAFNTAVSMELWRFLEDVIDMFKQMADLMKDKSMPPAAKPPNINKFLVWSWGSCGAEVTCRSHHSVSMRNPLKEKVNKTANFENR